LFLSIYKLKLTSYSKYVPKVSISVRKKQTNIFTLIDNLGVVCKSEVPILFLFFICIYCTLYY